jgi:hypothetical protein
MTVGAEDRKDRLRDTLCLCLREAPLLQRGELNSKKGIGVGHSLREGPR